MILPIVLRLCLLVLACYTALRGGYWLTHWQDLEQSGWPLVKDFLWGLRFDLSTIAFANAPVIALLCLQPRQHRQAPLHVLAGILFIGINAFLLACNIVDLEYTKFTGMRITIQTFALSSDIDKQFWQIATYYWYYFLLMVATPLLLGWGYWHLAYQPTHQQESKPHSWSWTITERLLTLLLIALAARGGWQTKPLIPAQAYQDASPQQAILRLNSSFTLIKSIYQNQLEPYRFFGDPEELQQHLGHFQSRPQPAALSPQTNIVLLVLESFSSEYTGRFAGQKSYTPFLDELGQKGLRLQQSYANGRRSIDAIPSLIAGIPAWMKQAFITSPYQTVELKALPHVLHDAGYQSVFFHGGYPGTMFFDAMAYRFGFDHYVDASAYHGSGERGHWGVHDEPFLNFTNEYLKGLQRPFLATIFTLSSHHPYEIPKRHKSQFESGTLEIHASISYADYSLRQFFEQAKQSNWYENTLFILTADHTSKLETSYYQTLDGSFDVPIIFYHPSLDLSTILQNKIGQHIDIAPTILDLLGLYQGIMPLGDSLRQQRTAETPPLSILFLGYDYLGISDQYRILFHPPTGWQAFAAQDRHLQQPLNLEKPEIVQLIKKFQAKLQYYRNGLIENRLAW